MLKEAIEKILSLSAPHIEQFNGLDYTDRAVHPVKPPMKDTQGASTLTGLIDLLRCHINELCKLDCFIHVESPTSVSVAHLFCNQYGERQQHIAVELPKLGQFEFGRYLGQEEFIIGLQAFFELTQGREELLRMVSSITGEQSSLSEDDGISQKVTVKAGVTLKTEKEAKRVVALKPYRTFREIDQPTSLFVFRVKTSPNSPGPQCALFEADGGMWKLDAAQRIKAWIEENNPGMPVIA